MNENPYPQTFYPVSTDYGRLIELLEHGAQVPVFVTDFHPFNCQKAMVMAAASRVNEEYAYRLAAYGWEKSARNKAAFMRLLSGMRAAFIDSTVKFISL